MGSKEKSPNEMTVTQFVDWVLSATHLELVEYAEHTGHKKRIKKIDSLIVILLGEHRDRINRELDEAANRLHKKAHGKIKKVRTFSNPSFPWTDKK